MERFVRPALFCLILLLIAAFAITPPEKQLRLGKDLRGGTTLVYQVQVTGNADPGQVIADTIAVLEDRIDPTGLLEIQMVRQGRDRIEISMPLPRPEVKDKREEFEQALAAIAEGGVDAARIDSAVRIEDSTQRAEAIDTLAGGDADQASALVAAAAAWDESEVLRETYRAAVEAEWEDSRIAEVEQELVDAELAYERARDAAVSETPDPEVLRNALRLSDEQRVLKDENDENQFYDSARDSAIEDLKAQFPEQATAIETAVAVYEEYESIRTGLDDTDDLKRLVAASGVPGFRIAVDPLASGSGNTYADEQELREQLREQGPLNASDNFVRWCKVNNVEVFAGGPSTISRLELLEADAATYFQSIGFVGEEYGGEYWILCWDTRDKALTRATGEWAVAAAFPTTDNYGRAAVGFRMDARGAQRLGALTGPNQGNRMAVLLDEEVYTAPNLNAAISSNGIIEGSFSPEEIAYIVKVLSAGSLQARLSPEPLSENTIEPEFGTENLRTGRQAGLVALVAVSAFMALYYFAFGIVAVMSLIFNAVLILGAMALARASFTLPGIAGVILTFGMAVDANVLIYERIREEQRRGADLRSAARLGYQKALSAIVDGNVTNLIVCFILGTLGTQEIKGFAITLGIGVVGTMISALVFARLLINLFVDALRVKSLPMLPTAVPALEKLLEPKINWMGARFITVPISLALIGLGVTLVVVQNKEMLDTEFTGGTQATIEFAEGKALTQREVTERIEKLAVEAEEEGTPLVDLLNADIIVVDSLDGVTSGKFQIKTTVTQSELVLAAISEEFAEELDSRPPVRFTGDTIERLADAPVYPILSNRLSRVIPGRADLTGQVGPYVGGVAILLDGIEAEGISLDDIEQSLEDQRQQTSFSDTLGRNREVRVIAGTDDSVRAAVVLVADENISYTQSEDVWRSELASVEWDLVRQALRDTTTLASVQSFSAVIAEDFQQTAIVSVVLSLLLILIYIWVRFGSVRYSLAAIITLMHDVIIVIGLIALAEILYEGDATQGLAQTLGIEPFKIDLSLVAALLTIIGYSLNDTIIIMDRIRENRGRLPYASKQVINDSINQTISRTVITSGTTFIATAILFFAGGAGVKAFAYALLCGVVVGTYSSIAVASPLVWSRKQDRTAPTPTESDERRLA
ncbi:MAG: protein translocase subunit SecD [Planctomycetota bacterium]